MDKNKKNFPIQMCHFCHLSDKMEEKALGKFLFKSNKGLELEKLFPFKCVIYIVCPIKWKNMHSGNL